MIVSGLRRATQEKLDHILDEAECYRALALACEDEARAFRRRCENGSVVSPAHGAFARTIYWESLNPREKALHIIRAEAARHPSWIFRSHCAALIWGLDVPYPLLDTTSIIAARPPRPCIIAARRPSLRDEIESVDGIKVTSFWQTVSECLREAPFSYGLAIADSALRRTNQTRANLMSHLEKTRGYPGIRQARFIASYADGRSENGEESRVRAFFIAHGYPIPELQVDLPNPIEPARPFRVDYYWELSHLLRIAGGVRRKAEVPRPRHASRQDHRGLPDRRAAARIALNAAWHSRAEIHLRRPFATRAP
ncbi:MAG: hypothetical protein MSH55_00580 [Enorma sp.]|nr:hypothetical protein [Enorma sp.]